MTHVDAPIWYDGAKRDRRDALERIERDAICFLERAVSDFAADDGAWLALLDGTNIPIGLDAEDYGTFSRSFRIEVDDARVRLHLSERLPRRLEATYAALTAKPWCRDAVLRPGTIELGVHGLDQSTAERIEQSMRAQADTIFRNAKRSVAALEALAAPDPLTNGRAALTASIDQIEAMLRAKLRRVRAARAVI